MSKDEYETELADQILYLLPIAFILVPVGLFLSLFFPSEDGENKLSDGQEEIRKLELAEKFKGAYNRGVFLPDTIGDRDGVFVKIGGDYYLVYGTEQRIKEILSTKKPQLISKLNLNKDVDGHIVYLGLRLLKMRPTEIVTEPGLKKTFVNSLLYNDYYSYRHVGEYERNKYKSYMLRYKQGKVYDLGGSRSNGHLSIVFSQNSSDNCANYINDINSLVGLGVLSGRYMTNERSICNYEAHGVKGAGTINVNGRLVYYSGTSEFCKNPNNYDRANIALDGNNSVTLSETKKIDLGCSARLNGRPSSCSSVVITGCAYHLAF